MLRMEYGEEIPEHLVTPQIGPPVDPAHRAREEEFKAKIMDMVNRQREEKEVAEKREQALLQPSAAVAAAALDPNIQKALDSLIKSGPNLLSQLK